MMAGRPSSLACPPVKSSRISGQSLWGQSSHGNICCKSVAHGTVIDQAKRSSHAKWPCPQTTAGEPECYHARTDPKVEVGKRLEL